MSRRLAFFCVVCLSVLLFAGCLQVNVPTPPVTAPLASPEVSPTPPPVSPTVSAVVTPSATPSPSPSLSPSPSPSVGVTEKKIGFVQKAWTASGKNYITIDYVDFLTGQAAIDKAVADGKAEIDEHGNYSVPNDYYISNENPMLRTFELSPSCAIRVVNQSHAPDLKSVTFTQFKTMGPTFGAEEMLMHIDVKDGVVQSLKEEFRP